MLTTKIKKAILLSVIGLGWGLGMGAVPVLAKIDGRVSTSHFYDVDKTIMTEISPDMTLKTGKYWEKNLLYFNKYRPLFMLSNKELYKLMPKENVGVYQRISAPSIYNVSLKNNSIKAVSLTPVQSKKQTPNNMSAQDVARTTAPTIAYNVSATGGKRPDLALISMYEDAKNPEAEPEKRIDTAILLKDSKNPANYDLALDLLDDAIRKEPYNAYAYYLKGELYTEKNDSENAMKNYVEALKLNPTSKQSCLGIAKILEPTNKELAQKYYERAK